MLFCLVFILRIHSKIEVLGFFIFSPNLLLLFWIDLHVQNWIVNAITYFLLCGGTVNMEGLIFARSRKIIINQVFDIRRNVALLLQKVVYHFFDSFYCSSNFWSRLKFINYMLKDINDLRLNKNLMILRKNEIVIGIIKTK